MLNVDVRLQLQFQLENEYLLWIVLPNNRPIEPLDTKIIRIRYYYTGEGKFKKFCSFSFPTYVIKGRAGLYPLSIYIRCPAGLQLKVNKSGLQLEYPEDQRTRRSD